MSVLNSLESCPIKPVIYFNCYEILLILLNFILNQILILKRRMQILLF